MPDSLMPVTSATAVRYKYYTVDIMSNTLIGEIPFEDVSYELALKQAGTFDGRITISNQTNSLDLYKTTLPGKTALYVVRDNVCVWGGIIWGRSYDLVTRSLSVSASEFTSYLNHRLVWKTYSSNFTGEVTKDAGFAYVGIVDRTMKAPPPVKDQNGNSNMAYIVFKDRAVTKFNGPYSILSTTTTPSAPSDPTISGFYINLTAIPKPRIAAYSNVGVSLRADTYEYVRELINNAFEDFIDIDFPNEILAPGIAKAVSVAGYSITSTGTYTGEATITTSKPHKLAKGQTVNLANIDDVLFGEFVVSDTPTLYTFTVKIANRVSADDRISILPVENKSYSTVSVIKDKIQYREIISSSPVQVTYVQRSSGVVTLWFKTRHRFIKNDVVAVKIANAAPVQRTIGGKVVNTMDWSSTGDNNMNIINVASGYSIQFLDPKYTSSSYDIPKTATKVPKNNTVALATPRTQLKLYPRDSHGYGAGDRIKISGVDSINWPTPLYDGYNIVVDSDQGTPKTIVAYEADGDDNTVLLYFNEDPDILESEFITVTSTNSVIKGTHQIEKVTPANENSSQWTLSFIKNIDADIAKTSVSGSTASVYGTSWITMDPGYDQLSTVNLVEPDSTAQIASLEYDTGISTKDRAGTVYVNTVDRHVFRVGDTVKVNFTDAATDKIYGGRSVVVKGNSDGDTIVYKLADASTPFYDVKKSPKKGLLTRTKARISGTPIVEATIRQIHTDGNLVTAISDDHNLAVGDNIIVTFSDSTYSNYDSNGGTVKIIEATENTFKYYVPGDIDVSSEVIVRNISFPKTKNKVDKATSPYTVVTRVVTDNFIADSAEQGNEDTEQTFAVSIGSIQTEMNATGDDYVVFTTTGANATNFSIGDSVTIEGLPDQSSDQPSVVEAKNLAPYKIEFKCTNAKKKTGVARMYLDVNPELAKTSKVVLSGFTAQKALGTSGSSKQKNKVITINMWGLQGTTTGTRTVAVKPIVDTYLKNKKFKADEYTLGYGTLRGSTGIPLNYYIDVPCDGKYSISWTWDSAKSTSSTPLATRHGSDKGNVYMGAHTDPSKISAKQIVKYSVYNDTGVIKKMTTNKETFWVKTTQSVAIPANTPVSGFNVTATVKKKITAVFNKNGPSTASPEVFVGDTFKISGLKDSGTNKYSIFNGKDMQVLKVVKDPSTESPTGQERWTDITLRSPHKVLHAFDPKPFNYPNNQVKATSSHNVAGVAVLDYGSISSETRDITALARSSSSTATLTSPGHGLAVGDWVNVWTYGKNTLSLNGNNEPVQITSVPSEDTLTYTIPGADSVEISHYSIAKNTTKTTVTLTVATGYYHRFVVGDTIELTSFPSAVSSQLTGTAILVTATPRTLSFIKTVTLPTTKTKALASTGTVTLSTAASITDVADETAIGVILPSPMISREPIAFTRTYGEYSQSANLGGVEFSTSLYSALNSKNTPLRGSDLVNLGQHLEEYSNTITGFDYRIDCELYIDPTTGNKKFKRIFRLIPLYPASLTKYINSLPLQDDPYNPNGNRPQDRKPGLAPGQSAPPIAFGADKIVFEYPGNISNISFAENAENSATRVFVSSANGQAGGGDAAYSGAVSEDLLADGWPLLDKAEKADWPLIGNDKTNIDSWGNYDSELDLYRTAKRFAYESKPPAGNFIITVNGSLNPVVGSYSPGDWCSIIVNDDFVKHRLESTLEPRKDVIVRKIDSVKVTVPNNPAFPEQIDLAIVTDWQVDRVGE